MIMASSTSSGQGTLNQLSVQEALEIVRNSEERHMDQAALTVIERALAQVWARIQAQPNSYVMTKDEFAVFNYNRNRFLSSDVAQRAVARFWDQFRESNGPSA